MRNTLGRLIAAFLIAASFSGAAVASTTDEEGLFTTVSPEAYFLLDLSSSMYGPPNAGYYWPQSFSSPACEPPFYTSDTAPPGYTTLCSRFEAARRTIFNVLDDNADGTIDAFDERSLNVRIGWGKFHDVAYTHMYDIGTKYSLVYCGKNDSCTEDGDYTNPSNSVRYQAGRSAGATPLVAALYGAKSHVDARKAADDYRTCRQRFVILLSDGADTRACDGNGQESQTTQFARRRDSIRAAKAIKDAGYKLFVIGMGASMPTHTQNTLNWMAYYGGTENPTASKSGSTSAFDPATKAICDTSDGTYWEGPPASQWFANSNDPGKMNLSGYAVVTGTRTELQLSLRQAIASVREATYSFSQSSVAASRLVDENFIYEASFTPRNWEPFWTGRLKKYQINDDGSIGSVVDDAGERLRDKSAGTRAIKTYKAGALVDFTTANFTKQDLGVSTDTRRNEVVGFIRGEDAYNMECSVTSCPSTPGDPTANRRWKLGDTFRSNPVTVGTPAQYFRDQNDANGAFGAFRANNPRTTANGNRIVVIGANDGQVHAFRTSDMNEVWSFIPPNLLRKLNNIAHPTHPTGLQHQYYVDGPITVADAWLGTGAHSSKQASDWRTLMIFGEGRGASDYLWSSSQYCDDNFKNVYSTARPYYCGYHALDITSTGSPAYKWAISFPDGTAGYAPYLGDPWSKMVVGRVKIGGSERWVGFLGGGHNLSSCSGSSCDRRGKGFFVVDLKDGKVLWAYTNATNNTDMKYAVPGTASVADLDNDGFIDTAWIGDLGGNMWRFKFCDREASDTCTTANWAGGLLFRGGGSGQVYAAPTGTRDASGNLWVYWGTGDKTEPIVRTTSGDKFFAVKDDRTSTRTLSDLSCVDDGTYTDTSKKGWYINLAGTGEKFLSEPTMWAGSLYFTTYIPSTSPDPCDQGGTAMLYGINYITGGGTLMENAKKTSVGTGIPTSPVTSLNPIEPYGTDMYVTVSGAGTTSAQSLRTNVTLPPNENRTNILFWRDSRIQ